MLTARALFQHAGLKTQWTARLAHLCTAGPVTAAASLTARRNASTLIASTTPSQPFMFIENSLGVSKPLSLAEQVSRMRPFSAPPAPLPATQSPTGVLQEEMQLTSILRKRRLKMNKHKHKKLRKRTRALRKRLGK